MKNSVIYLLISIFTLTTARAAPNIDSHTRQQIAQTLTRIVGREVVGANVKVEGVKASKSRVQVYASVGLSYYPFREANTEAMCDSVKALLPRKFAKARIELYSDQREVRDLIPMAYRRGVPSKKSRPVPFVNPSERPLVERLSSPVMPAAGLMGRHIALWQSHGRYFDQKENRWRWQRVRLWETCEDLYTQSYVLPYLVPMLENAGAYVLLPRERDVQKHEVLADNDTPGQYREEGSAVWQCGGGGFAHRQQVYLSGENPFRHGTTRRTTTVAKDADESRAVWRADIPERGEYAVYVSYEATPHGADDALYLVRHLGGVSRFAVNQTMGGGTWVYLGRFLLDAGSQDVVILSNRSRTAGRTLSADAVKIGGGFGNVARSVSDSLRHKDVEYMVETSGYPRFCEGARYWLQWAGFDEKVYTPKQNQDDYKDDYMSRAHWVNALMGGSQRLPDSVGLRVPVDMALAFHSDAGVRDGDEIVGTLGIFYTKDKDTKGRFAGGADRYRSRDLTDIVQTQIVSDIRRAFEPGWSRRGLWNRSYYEARVPGVPTMLLELLSHQNFADMRYGSDPRFKFTVGRAVYKGILRYLSSQYGTPYVVQPLPVQRMKTDFTSDDRVRLSWEATLDSLEATAVPTGYIVYTRIGDGGFDQGQYTSQTEFIAAQEPGEIYSYKVTAVNDGGESMPGEVLAACLMPHEKGRVVVVNGFERVSAPLSMRCDSLAGFYNDRDGGVPDRQDISYIGDQCVFDLAMARCENDQLALGACRSDYETDVIGGNTFDYPYVHGKAIAAAGYSFCSLSLGAAERDGLEGASAVDLILGKQRSTKVGRGVRGVEFETFSPDLQRVLRQYIAHGGALFVSGSYVGTDLWTGPNASEEGRDFAREVLHFTFDRGHAAVRGRVQVTSSLTDFSRGEYRYHTELGRDHYSVEAPDALRPAGQGALSVMRYMENGRTAAVASTSGSRTFVMGFPFESITSDGHRERLMRDVLKFMFNNK